MFYSATSGQIDCPTYTICFCEIGTENIYKPIYEGLNNNEMKLTIKQIEHLLTELLLTHHIFPKLEWFVSFGWFIIPCKTTTLKSKASNVL